jgi:hypothetical protein
MIIGNPSRFAIESEITSAVERRSQMALGFFVIHILDHKFGVRKPDATMLGGSFGEVARRIKTRGSRPPQAAAGQNASEIARAFRRIIYEGANEGEMFFGRSASELAKEIHSNQWEWDCDEAFDDGSYVLQLDEGNEVRLIAFVGTPDFRYDPSTLREVHLSPDEFYGILREWSQLFYSEWRALLSKPS